MTTNTKELENKTLVAHIKDLPDGVAASEAITVADRLMLEAEQAMKLALRVLIAGGVAHVDTRRDIRAAIESTATIDLRLAQ